MTTEKPTIHIVGAGLAGSECALQLADLGYSVVLIEMRDGEKSTPAHKTADCAELVCSNSFGSLAGHSAPGELKWEAEQLGSRVLEAAFEARVPAGQALGMDRDVFARAMTRMVNEHPRIKLERRVVQSLDELPRPCVVATGPLTEDSLARSMQDHFGDEFLYFFDAIAPIIATESVNMNVAWRADRWDKGTKDYINCPMNRKEYLFFIDELKAARKTEPKEFEKDTPYFESCMPIEAMVERGIETPRFGPMSAKGLTDPRTGNWPYAVVQLRQDNKDGTAYNMVGFQTKMAYAEQKRVFRLIPGLEEAEFLKLGSIHRNLYINTPKRLNRDLSSKKDPLLFFAGQITGVEGYFESTCMGLMVARFLDHKVRGVLAPDASNIASVAPPRASALGSLLEAITDETKIEHFQPTNINFGHMPPIIDAEPEPGKRFKKTHKNAKREMQIANARAAMREWLAGAGIRAAESHRVEDAARDLAAIVAAAEAAEAAEVAP
ncbi:MAG: methylenetetrahydrofolate--tRNA-(uracil(54)-C(5))-methyltransferase (FADH(2)-oxidizing) TrmFO [Bdellovibrionota bacterium]